MREFVCFCYLVILPTLCAHAVNVFVHVDYVNALTGEAPCATASLSEADKDNRPDCFAELASYFLEGACYPRVSSSFQTGLGSSAWFALNGTHYCRQGFVDQACQSPSDAANPCTDLFARGYDAYLDRERFIFSDMCMETPVPQGDFRIPVVETRVYADLETCRAKENNNDANVLYSNQLLLMDQESCLPDGPPLQDQADTTSSVIANGAFVIYCDGIQRRASIYSNKDCSSQVSTPPLQTTEFNVLGCTKVPVSGSTLHLYSDCGQIGAASYHCKSFPSIGLGIDLKRNIEGTNPTAPPSGASATDRGLFWASVILGFVSWTALLTIN